MCKMVIVLHRRIFSHKKSHRNEQNNRIEESHRKFSPLQNLSLRCDAIAIPSYVLELLVASSKFLQLFEIERT